MAKSYGPDADSSGSTTVTALIAEQMVEFVRRHPLYQNCDGIVAVLPSNPEKAFDLPAVLAASLEKELGMPYLNRATYKTRPTAQMKYCPTTEDKLDNISGSVGARRKMVAGKRLLVVDDILESGITLNETANSLRAAGTEKLFGLVATKTLKRKFL